MKCDISTQTVETSFNETKQEQPKQIKKPTTININVVNDWLKNNASILFNSSLTVRETRYVYAKASDVNASFRAYKRLVNDKTIKSLEPVELALSDLGFEFVKTSLTINDKRVTGVRIYRIEANKFNDVIERPNVRPGKAEQL